MILPLFDYYDVVFGNINVSHLNHIQKLQNRGAQITLGLDRHSHVSDMLSELKWLNIKQKQDLFTAIPTYKTNIGQSNVSDVNSYVTRSSINGDLSVPNVNLVAEKENIPIQSHYNMECDSS